ncbi:hypothetical protein [Methylobacterium sp. WL19]|uniref:hypothetical protein n=1 Tax=Methylobacterium sp. WL19 TaxID=2603896 RepID=UPI0011C89366|nr:hypothetical protein [Methylobacterium sp. WL19]TXN27144.1 hypothetical protein FV220_12545 [Methylobacterium sp. WL19]
MANASRRALLCGVAALPVLTVPFVALAVDPHDAYRERLHVAHTEHQRARPIENVARHGSMESRAADLVHARLWHLADEVLNLPMPTTLSGLGVMGLAMAVIVEGCISRECQEEWRQAQLARAILAMTGEKLPVMWVGWGDDPGAIERDFAALDEPGTLPAWAMAEAARQCA